MDRKLVKSKTFIPKWTAEELIRLKHAVNVYNDWEGVGSYVGNRSGYSC